MWVDDCAIFAESLSDANEVINALKETFGIKIIEVDTFLGIEISKNRETKSIFLHQEARQ